MKLSIKALAASLIWTVASAGSALADQVLVIDAGYSTVTQSVQGRLEAAGHTVTVTTNTSTFPTTTGAYQQVWDLRPFTALSASESGALKTFITNGGFVYFSTENPGCCGSRNASVAELVTALGGGATTIGANSTMTANVASNVNTTYMTAGITVNFAASSAIVNSQGIPLISDAQNLVAGMSWIGRAGALDAGVTGTIVTVADINWLDSARFAVGGTTEQQQNVTALDDIIRGIVAGTVAGTISASGNGSGSSGGGGSAPTTFDRTNASENVAANTMASGTFTGNGGTLSANSDVPTVPNDIVLNTDGMIYDANGQNSSITGVISGSGGLTFTGAGTTTLTGSNTYTGPTTVNTGASLINDGSIASSSGVTNNGTFVNNGAAPGVTNSGTFTNSATGTAASLSNSGTATNSGTITGAVDNSGTFTNSGTTGNWYNSGLVGNSGTMGNGTNVGTFANTGSVGTVANNGSGVFTNSGTTAAVANNATFTNNAGATTGAVANTGTFTNAGVVGNVTGNTGVFTNSGTAGSVTSSGTFTNRGTVGSVTNSGTFTTSGTVGGLTNTGTLNYNGGTLGSYTQTAGSTVMNFATPIAVTNAANLGGSLVVNNSPTAYGRYRVLSAAGVSGTYSSLTSSGSNDYLKYSGTDVKLYVTPPQAETQASIDAFAKNLGNAINLQGNAAAAGLSNDCAVLGDSSACFTINYGSSKAAAGDLNSGGITVSKVVNDKWKFGLFSTKQFGDAAVGNIRVDSGPAMGAYVTYSDGPMSVQVSGATGDGSFTITRAGPETGVGTSQVKNTAFQIKGSYLIPLGEGTSVTPYVGLRQTETQMGGYTETGPVFPLTVNASTSKSTDIIAGATLAKRLTDDLTATVSAGMVSAVSRTHPQLTGSSEIRGLTTFSSAIPKNGNASGVLGAGLSYAIDKTTRLGLNVGWQQKSANADISSIGVSLTKGF